MFDVFCRYVVKDPISGLRKFSITKSPLKMMKIAFLFFMLKPQIVLGIYIFILSFCYAKIGLNR